MGEQRVHSGAHRVTILRPVLLALAAVGSGWLAVSGWASSPELVETDSLMNKDIVDQGNDIHAMRSFMDDEDMAYSFHRHGFFNLHELYKQAPTERSPDNVNTIQTEYAVVSAGGDLGVTYGIWNSIVIGDSTDIPADFYRDFVFGLRSGLWTAKWSPRGAPRHFYYRYVRVWRRAGPGQPWRLAAGPFVAESDDSAGPPPAVPDRFEIQPRASNRANDTAVLRSLEATDRAYAAMLRDQGLRSAFGRFAADDIYVMRNLKQTVIGRQAFLQLGKVLDVRLEMAPAGMLMARSRDLRVVYGFEYRVEDREHPKPALYADVWRYQEGAWRLIFSYYSDLE